MISMWKFPFVSSEANYVAFFSGVYFGTSLEWFEMTYPQCPLHVLQSFHSYLQGLQVLHLAWYYLKEIQLINTLLIFCLVVSSKCRSTYLTISLKKGIVCKKFYFYSTLAAASLQFKHGCINWGQKGHVPLPLSTIWKLSTHFSSKVCHFFFVGVPLNACDPQIFNAYYVPWVQMSNSCFYLYSHIS